jgi:lipid A 4'-phosphatase
MFKPAIDIRRATLAGIPLCSLIAAAAAALLFSLYPSIDIGFSALFYRPGGGFFLSDAVLVRFLYKSVEVLIPAYILALIIIWIMKKKPFGLTGKKLLYLLLVLAVGPGLMVNVVFKDHWGRARPRQIQAFGGSKRFTPPLVISDQCDTNCAFASGHAAAGFYFIALALIMESHRRRIYAGALAYGALVGLARIAQGGHFLSDVLFAFFIVYFIAKGIYCWMFEHASFLRATKR